MEKSAKGGQAQKPAPRSFGRVAFVGLVHTSEMGEFAGLEE